MKFKAASSGEYGLRKKGKKTEGVRVEATGNTRDNECMVSSLLYINDELPMCLCNR